MKTRLIAAIAAVVLAIVGTVVLVGYVRGADTRAMAGTEMVQVLVAAQPIPQGTKAADVAALAALKELPAISALPGRVTGLDQIAGQVALVALVPGEQLLASKFGPPSANTPAQQVAIPLGMQQVTVLLDLPRALGGQIKAGDTVGIFLSVTDAKKTHLTAHKVLVTMVQRAAPKASDTTSANPTPSSAGVPAPSSAGVAVPAPSDLGESLLVTVATTAPVAEKIVWAASFGSIWLSNEPLTATEGGTQIVDGTLMTK